MVQYEIWYQYHFRWLKFVHNTYQGYKIPPKRLLSKSDPHEGYSPEGRADNRPSQNKANQTKPKRLLLSNMHLFTGLNFTIAFLMLIIFLPEQISFSKSFSLFDNTKFSRTFSQIH